MRGKDHTIYGDARLSVRRCFGDEEAENAEVVELTIETTKNGWFMSSIALFPEQAIAIARDLLHEATVPLVPGQ